MIRQVFWICLIFWVCGCGKPDDTTPPGNGSNPVGPLEHAVRETAGDSPEVVSSRIRFQDQTSASGVQMTYRNGEEAGHFAILESLGGGVGLLDYDLDGTLDLFLPGGGTLSVDRKIGGLPAVLYRQTDRWRFEDCTGIALGPQRNLYSHGAAAADYDNDGFPDVLVTGYGGLQLFHNNGDGTFTETAQAAQLHDTQWSSSAGWGDIDRDGDLDLYVAHYVDWSFENNPFCGGPPPHKLEICPPRRFRGLTDTLYRNGGDGTFTDVSVEMKLTPEGKGLGVLLADIDLDGGLEIYVCNDTVANFLYRTGPDGKLEDISLISGTALCDRGLPNGSMGVSLADYNQDGQFDIWVANYENESFALYKNQGDCFFQHSSQVTGVTSVGPNYVGWGTLFGDFDQDGDEDIFASNGHVIRFPPSGQILQSPLLFDNREGTFLTNVAPQVGTYFNESHHGRGVAGGDIDRDGDLDLVVSRLNQPAVLLSNESQTPGHWLQVRLTGSASSRTPIGATVFVQTDQATRMRQLAGGNSYASTHDTALHFGLGPAERIESLEVRWPSGKVQQLQDVAVNQTLHLLEPEG